jgi:hypothetical protein
MDQDPVGGHQRTGSMSSDGSGDLDPMGGLQRTGSMSSDGSGDLDPAARAHVTRALQLVIDQSLQRPGQAVK